MGSLLYVSYTPIKLLKTHSVTSTHQRASTIVPSKDPETRNPVIRVLPLPA